MFSKATGRFSTRPRFLWVTKSLFKHIDGFRLVTLMRVHNEVIIMEPKSRILIPEAIEYEYETVLLQVKPTAAFEWDEPGWEKHVNIVGKSLSLSQLSKVWSLF